MREIIARSLYSSDLEQAEWEVAIDRIGALRGSGRLGSALFRWKHGLDRASRGKAYVLTLKLASRELRIAPRHPAFEILKRAVKQALTEWHSPACRDCNGVGMIRVSRQQELGTTMVDHVCQSCSGTGSHRYTDWQRREALKVEKLGPWSGRVDQIRNLVSAREIGLIVGARRELER